jgi:hypothetical protein
MEIIHRFFGRRGSVFCRQLSTVIQGVLRAGSSSTGLISQQISLAKDINFASADSYVYRFLKDDSFQIDDSFWRCHTNMLYQLLEEKHGLKQGDNIEINVDYTTINDDFLILMASVTIAGEKDIALYFTMRNYPKRKNQMDQKKMELAFFKGLRHVLSKKYNYTIVADRGFGNLRIIEICEDLGFNFVIRIKEDLKLETKDKKAFNLKEFKGKTTSFKATVLSWKKELNFHVRTKNGETWYIVASSDKAGCAEVYERRFKIEKLFQDIKSSGYNIEKTQIRKYERVKRILYTILAGHAISTFFGVFIKSVKKNYPSHWELAKVFLNSEN